jgi:protein-S-isoprenylcysteine O-methyltransferase Ste14
MTTDESAIGNSFALFPPFAAHGIVSPSLVPMTQETQLNHSPSRPDIPGVIAPPVVLYAIFFVGTFLLQRICPLPIPLSGRAAFWPTAIFLNLSGVLALWAAWAMVRAKTRINPLRPATCLVRYGPFKYSRNPLSISLVLLYVGMAFQINTLWPMFFLPAFLIVYHYGIIRREERYLESKFGDEYRNYCASVRRWL